MAVFLIAAASFKIAVAPQPAVLDVIIRVPLDRFFFDGLVIELSSGSASVEGIKLQSLAVDVCGTRVKFPGAM